MNLKQEIELIKKQLDEVEDEKLLNIISDLLAYGKTKSIDLKPFTEEEYFKRYDDSIKSIESGLIAQEDVVNYFKKKKERE